MNIFISTSSFGKYDDLPLRMLKDCGYDVQLNPHGRKLTTDECLTLYKNIDGLIAGTEMLDASVLKSAENLKIISRCGVGIDNVDSKAARELGIKLYSTPDGPTLAVAELTVGLILALLRQVPQMDRDIRDGTWKKRMGNLLQGQHVGVIGFGRIGRKTAEILTNFGTELAYCDPMVLEAEAGYLKMGLMELLSWANIITIHVSGQQMLIGHNELQQMNKGAWLVSCARGGVVDETALYQALKERKISGAAIDCFGEEPYYGPLKELDNVILTPHIGSYAIEARVNMEVQSVNNLITGFSDIRFKNH